jgi:hypothetical protein
MLPEEDKQQLINEGKTLRTINNDTIVFSQTDLSSMVVQALRRQIPDGAIVLMPSLMINEQKWRKQTSGNLFRAEMKAIISYHIRLPLDTWPAEIKGLSAEEAKKILMAKSGVEAVTIEFFPGFLAKISQKIPSDTAGIRFTLDTD